MRKIGYLLVLVVALFVFNPDEEDFSSFVQERSGRFFSTRTSDTEVGRILSDLGANVTRALAEHVTSRDNYFLFSIFTVDLDGEEAEEEEWKFLGIASRFVTLSEPEGLNGEADG